MYINITVYRSYYNNLFVQHIARDISIDIAVPTTACRKLPSLCKNLTRIFNGSREFANIRKLFIDDSRKMKTTNVFGNS